MNELIRFLSRAVLWRLVGRLMSRRSGPVLGLLGVAALVAFLVTAR